MDVTELLEIALASVEDRRVEVTTLEPADISMEAVGGVAQILAELAENALDFSDPEDRVRIAGLFTGDDYLITVSDHGVGIPETLIAALNRVLADPSDAPSDAPSPRMGIQLVARLAHRHGIDVRLVPAVPGTTARIAIPARLVRRGEDRSERSGVEPRPDVDTESGIFNPFRSRPGVTAPETAATGPGPEEKTVDLTRYETAPLFARGHVVAMTDSARAEAEEFLARVFAPLMTKSRGSERPTGRAERGGNDSGPVEQARRPDPGERLATTTRLRVRVPGENFEVTDDDASTTAAEGAIDIRAALTRYQQGRRSAAKKTER